MKIATYNILKGGTQRVHWIKMIEDYGVDLLFVQESYTHDDHLPPLIYPNARSQSVWEVVEQNRWGSAVYSKSGFVKPVAVPEYPGWVVGAEITGASWHADPLFAFSVHAPAFNGSYSKSVNKILDEIKKVVKDGDVVIGGDFNLTVSYCLGSERPVNKRDLAIQARLADEFGLLNCWQAANPNQPLHQTLRWTTNRSTPYHCDGLFVPKSWQDRLESCVVLSGEDWNRLSDHNPVMACFT
jgi:endonuclease/exonuclease/phosphatase family metal-dependent hydrolase